MVPSIRNSSIGFIFNDIKQKLFLHAIRFLFLHAFCFYVLPFKNKVESDTRTQRSGPALKKTQTNSSKDNSTSNKILKHLCESLLIIIVPIT